MPETTPLLRVLYLYYEPSPSGQTEHVLSLVQGLDRTRFEAAVILPDLLASQVQRFEAAGIRVCVLPIRKLVWPISAVTGLIAEIRRWKPDLVHIHSQEAGMTGRVLTRIAGGMPIFYTPQTIDIRRKHWQNLYRFGERLLAKITRCILSVNESDRRRLIQNGIPDEKIVTVYNGVDLNRFDRHSPAPAEAAALKQPGRALVMQVGRMSEQKAPFDFIEGARLVLREAPDTRFVLLGDGHLLEAVKEKTRAYGLDGQIIPLGAHTDAYRWVQVADIVTLTSHWEGSPYSLLEAMAWYKPVVATRVNGCTELVLDGETGYLTPPGEPREWAERVLQLLRDPKLACEMGESGRRRLEANFTLPAMVEKISALYEEAAGK